MDTVRSFLYRKEIDWSLLHEGFSIPASEQYLFQTNLKDFLNRGNKINIKLLINNMSFNAELKNQTFDEEKFKKHKDVLQVRYSQSSNLAGYFRNVFEESYNKLSCLRKNSEKKQKISLPEYMKEYLLIYSTRFDGVFSVECIPINQIHDFNSYIKESKITEDNYELEMNYELYDPTSSIVEREVVIKQRRLNRSIAESLKILYDHRCQICGNCYSEKYGTKISEAHHIDFFTQSLNNDADNIIIICPNHHRVIHRVMPEFIRDKHLFQYSNGLQEKLMFNNHL
ncbi:MAG TPA: HNH endonuclease signature motif containing protein [Spirochaetota bacterium]|nr:HNH endonuclease signature motif containing protein [Spirochaetota bacterium]